MRLHRAMPVRGSAKDKTGDLDALDPVLADARTTILGFATRWSQARRQIQQVEFGGAAQKAGKDGVSLSSMVSLVIEPVCQGWPQRLNNFI